MKGGGCLSHSLPGARSLPSLIGCMPPAAKPHNAFHTSGGTATGNTATCLLSRCLLPSAAVVCVSVVVTGHTHHTHGLAATATVKSLVKGSSCTAVTHRPSMCRCRCCGVHTRPATAGGLAHCCPDAGVGCKVAQLTQRYTPHATSWHHRPSAVGARWWALTHSPHTSACASTMPVARHDFEECSLLL
jgi:hypothetical protein